MLSSEPKLLIHSGYSRKLGEQGNMFILPFQNLLFFFGGIAISVLAVSWIGTSRNIKSDTLMGLVVAAVLLGPIVIPFAFIPKRRSQRDR